MGQMFGWQALRRMARLRGRGLRTPTYQTWRLSLFATRDGQNLIPQTRLATNGTEGNVMGVVVLPTNAWRVAQRATKAGHALSCTPRCANSSQPLECRRVAEALWIPWALGNLAWFLTSQCPSIRQQSCPMYT